MCSHVEETDECDWITQEQCLDGIQSDESVLLSANKLRQKCVTVGFYCVQWLIMFMLVHYSHREHMSLMSSAVKHANFSTCSYFLWFRETVLLAMAVGCMNLFAQSNWTGPAVELQISDFLPEALHQSYSQVKYHNASVVQGTKSLSRAL